MDVPSFTSGRWETLIAVLGYNSLTVALLIAHVTPATEYELSIYAATPVSAWAGISMALMAALLLSFRTTKYRYRQIGVFLGGIATFSIASLPIIRGYFFHGIHDSVTHVGIARELVGGSMTPFETFYPGIHTLSAFIHGVVGYTLWQSTLFVPILITGVFFVFLPAVISEVVDSDRAVVIGYFSAFLLVPLHQLASTLHPHPSSQSTLFAPVVIFLLVRYLRSERETGQFSIVVPLALSLLTVFSAAVLLHPQQALNVLILFVAIGLFQYVSEWTKTPITPSGHRKLYSIVVVSSFVYLGWLSQSSTFAIAITGAIDSFLSYFAESTPVAGSAVGSQSSSLQAIGVSLPLMFVKLFLVSTVYILFACGILAVLYRAQLHREEVHADTGRLLWYLGFGLIGMVPVFIFYFVGDVGQYYFRQASFMMLMITTIGAIGMGYGISCLSPSRLRRVAHLTMVGGFAILFILSILVLFNSPHIHRANQHVTEAKVEGYETVFAETNDSAWLVGIRQEPQRYYDGIVSLEENGRRDGTVNSSSVRKLQDRRPEEWYLVINQNTYEREITAYREYRFSRSDLLSVRHQPNVNRVHTNGDTELYHVA